MRDVDDRDTARAEPLDQAEQLVDLARCQRRRGLVHHQNPAADLFSRLRTYGLGNLDHLPLRQAQSPDRRHRRQLHAELVEQHRGHRMQTLPVDQSGKRRRRRAEKDVFGSRELRNEVQLLVDHADAQRERITRRVHLHRTAVNDDGPGILAIGAAENLHQRRLPGAVFTEQHMDFAGVQR